MQHPTRQFCTIFKSSPICFIILYDDDDEDDDDEDDNDDYNGGYDGDYDNDYDDECDDEYDAKPIRHFCTIFKITTFLDHPHFYRLQFIVPN